MHSIIHSGLIGREERMWRKEDKRYSSQPWILCLILKKICHTTWWNHERYHTKQSGKCTKMQYIYWINPRSAQDKGLEFWQTRSIAVILHDSVVNAQNWRDSVSETFLLNISTTQNCFEGFLASSTRRFWAWRMRRSLKSTSESKVFHMLQSSKKTIEYWEIQKHPKIH